MNSERRVDTEDDSESAINALRGTGLHRCCCTFDCDQGRNCPTRQACELPLDDGKAQFWALVDSLRWAARWVGIVLLALFLVFLSAGYASAYWPRFVLWLSF